MGGILIFNFTLPPDYEFPSFGFCMDSILEIFNNFFVALIIISLSLKFILIANTICPYVCQNYASIKRLTGNTRIDDFTKAYWNHKGYNLVSEIYKITDSYSLDPAVGYS